MCNSETVGLSRKQVGRAAVYSVDREQDPAAEAPAAWRGRKPEEEAKAAKARARAKAASKEEANHIFRCQCRASNYDHHVVDAIDAIHPPILPIRP